MSFHISTEVNVRPFEDIPLLFEVSGAAENSPDQKSSFQEKSCLCHPKQSSIPIEITPISSAPVSANESCDQICQPYTSRSALLDKATSISHVRLNLNPSDSSLLPFQIASLPSQIISLSRVPMSVTQSVPDLSSSSPPSQHQLRKPRKGLCTQMVNESSSSKTPTCAQASAIVQRLHRREREGATQAAGEGVSRARSRYHALPNALRSRPALAQGRFEEVHKANFEGAATSNFEQVLDFFSVGVGGRLVFSANCAILSFLSFFPIIEGLRGYSLKQSLLADIITGLTVTVMQIPQGMAYGLLAGLTPVFGLYVSLIPVLVYFVFGTSKYVSVGTFAIISIMVSGPVVGLANAPPACVTTRSNPDSDTGLAYEVDGRTFNDGLSFRIAIATSLALLIGLLQFQHTDVQQLLLVERIGTGSHEYSYPGLLAPGLLANQIFAGFLRFGFVTVYLNEPMLTGFTTGAAVHVAISQIKYVLGINPSISGAFKIIRTIIAMIQRAHQFQLATFIVSLVCIVALYLLKEVVQPQFRKLKLPMGLNKLPLPFDLLVIVITLIVSHFAQLKNYGVAVVGTIPSGFPPITLPVFSLWSSFFTDAIIIAIVSYAVSISLARLFATKLNEDLDSNQEMIALGASNAISSFFSCYPGCASLSRSLMAQSGGGTQITGLVSALGLIVVILFLAPLLGELPKCVLAAVILVALKGMFMQLTQLPHLWRVSLSEFLIWVVTFLATVILDVDYGLSVGFGFSVLTIVLRTQSPHCALLGRIPHTDIYKDVLVYQDAAEIEGMKIFRFEGSLYFASCEKFREKTYLRTGVNPRELLRMKEKAARGSSKQTPPPNAGSTQLEIKRPTSANGDAPRTAGDTSTFPLETVEASTVLGRFRVERAYSEDSLSAMGIPLELLDDEVPAVPPPSESDAGAGLPERVAGAGAPVHHIILDCSAWAYIDLAGIRVLKLVCDEYKKAGIVVFLALVKSNVQKLLVRAGFYDKFNKNNVFLTLHDAVLGALRLHPTLLSQIILDAPLYPITRTNMSVSNSALEAESKESGGRGTHQSPVLTLRQVPLELPQRSCAHLPDPSRRAQVQVTQLSINPKPEFSDSNNASPPNGFNAGTVTTDVNTAACEVQELRVEIPQNGDLQSRMPQDNNDRSQPPVE